MINIGGGGRGSTSIMERESKKVDMGEISLRFFVCFCFPVSNSRLYHSHPIKLTRWTANESNESFNEFHFFLITPTKENQS